MKNGKDIVPRIINVLLGGISSMGKLLVQMNSHLALHNGHRELFNYGKSFGEVSVTVYRDLPTIWKYFSSGEKKVPKEDIDLSKLLSDLDELDIKYECKSLSHLPTLHEEDRARYYQEGLNLAIQNRDILLSRRYDDIIARRYVVSKLIHYLQNVDILCGPEIPYFFRRAFTNNFEGKGQIYIMPKMVQDPEIGIRYQMYKDIAVAKYSDIGRIKYMIDGARPFFKPGRNDKLVTELQEAYPTRSWTLKDIVVYEGDFVDGRLEVVSVTVPNPTGSGTLGLDSMIYEKA
jgi:hypothetical protein